MEILKVIRGLLTRDSGSSERLGFGARLSLRRKSRKTSLVSQGSASGVKGGREDSSYRREETLDTERARRG